MSGNLSNEDWQEAGRRGFAITSAGQAAFSAFLKTLHDRFWEGNGDFGGRAIYGRLYEMLAHENEDPAYDSIRDLLRETSVTSLPIGPDHRLFGIATSRRWHSVHTATKEFGLHHKTARKMFAAAGLIASDEEVPDGRLLVETDKMEEFIRRWQSSLKTGAAMKRLNVGRSAWEIFLKEGYISPLIQNYQDHGVAPLFPVGEIDAFIAKLERVAPIRTETERACVSVATAVKRAPTRLSKVLELLFEGHLISAHTMIDARGFDAVRVSVAEVQLALARS